MEKSGDHPVDTPGLARGGGIAGLATVGFLVAALALAFAAGYEGEDAWRQADLDAIMPALHDNTSIWVASMWGFLIGNSLMVAFALALHRTLPGRDATTGLAPWAVLVGVVIIHVDGLLAIGLAQGLAGPYVAASGEGLAALEAVAVALVHMRTHAYLLGFGLVATGTIMFGLRALRPSPLPRLIGWAALVAGTAIVVGSISPLAVLVEVGAGILLFGFLLPASIVLVRLPRSATGS